MAVGAYHADAPDSDNPGVGAGRGAVWLIKDGGDSWGSIVAEDVVKIDSGTTGLTLADGDHFGSAVSVGRGAAGCGGVWG